MIQHEKQQLHITTKYVTNSAQLNSSVYSWQVNRYMLQYIIIDQPTCQPTCMDSELLNGFLLLLSFSASYS